MSKLVEATQSWACKAMPRYDYGYLLERINTLGKEEEIKKFMVAIRQLHLREITEKEFEDQFT